METTVAVLAQLNEPEAVLELPQVEWVALTPLLVLVGGALFLLAASALITRRLPRSTWSLLTVGLSVAAIVASALLWDRVQDPGRGEFSALAGAITIDGFSIFFSVLIALSIGLAALLADDYLRREGLDGPELYALMLLSGAGGITMAMANDLIVVFLGLEILSISAVRAGRHAHAPDRDLAGGRR